MLVEWESDQETQKKGNKRGVEPPFSFTNARSGGFSLPCPDTPHPGERGRVSGGPMDGEVGTTDSGGGAPRAGRRPIHAPSQGERGGVERVKKGGGDATGLQPSTDDSSKADEPTVVVLCSGSHQKHQR